MKTLTQPELPVRTEAPLFTIRPEHPNVGWLIEYLQGRGWTTARDILIAAHKEVTDHNKRWVRALKKATGGKVIGGPGSPGYRLTSSCTQEEYQHFRNATLSQSDEMRAEVLAADRVFYGRQPVTPGHGILAPGGAAPPRDAERRPCDRASGDASGSLREDFSI